MMLRENIIILHISCTVWPTWSEWTLTVETFIWSPPQVLEWRSRAVDTLNIECQTDNLLTFTWECLNSVDPLRLCPEAELWHQTSQAVSAALKLLSLTSIWHDSGSLPAAAFNCLIHKTVASSSVNAVNYAWCLLISVFLNSPPGYNSDVFVTHGYVWAQEVSVIIVDIIIIMLWYIHAGRSSRNGNTQANVGEKFRSVCSLEVIHRTGSGLHTLFANREQFGTWNTRQKVSKTSQFQRPTSGPDQLANVRLTLH